MVQAGADIDLRIFSKLPSTILRSIRCDDVDPHLDQDLPPIIGYGACFRTLMYKGSRAQVLRYKRLRGRRDSCSMDVAEFSVGEVQRDADGNYAKSIGVMTGSSSPKATCR